MLHGELIHGRGRILTVYQTQFALIANWALRRPAYELFSTNDLVGFNSFGEHDRISSRQDVHSIHPSFPGDRRQETFCSVGCLVTSWIRNRTSRANRKIIFFFSSDPLGVSFHQFP